MNKEERITHWRAVITKHATSGLSAAAFCREHDISIHQFRWWQRRFRKDNSQSKESGFFQLVPLSKSQHSGIRIRLNNEVFIVMPNHVHVVLTPRREHTLSAILHSWKSFSANKANAILNRQAAEFWQRESYDHLVRGMYKPTVLEFPTGVVLAAIPVGSFLLAVRFLVLMIDHSMTLILGPTTEGKER